MPGTSTQRCRAVAASTVVTAHSSVNPRPVAMSCPLPMAFSRCGDQLELAHTLAELGDAPHAIGDSDRARMTVRRAWHVVKERRAESLLARLALTWSGGTEDGGEGFTALSDAERGDRGHGAHQPGDRQEALLTVSTVEQHLTRAYRKLDVRRRTDLPVRPHPTAS
ncbi:hypothetical protein [Allokutzneria oryzae]|uniref:HTH luxR-type domain-containing protein n=1 Tax=Allokutzneria oryzae TaxID=1378989 RepID=A0ABV5ZTB3_9PSEU